LLRQPADEAIPAIEDYAVLDDKRIGFIGAGMMAEAIARGLIASGIEPSRIVAYDPSEERRAFFHDQLGVEEAKDNAGVVQAANIVILAVKPFVMPEVLSSIGGQFNAAQLIISIAAGVTTEFIESKLKAQVPVVRVMPNTPCLIDRKSVV
jgi:pyrroline-5-carboxylate reductase